MVKIKFNKSTTSYYVNFRKISDNIVKLFGSGIPESTSGFKAYTENDMLLGDYSDFITVYAVDDDGIRFSNDGSVEPIEEITIGIEWVDEDESKRPNQVNITVMKNGIDFKDILTNATWNKIYKIKPGETLGLRNADDIEGYEKKLNDNLIIYTQLKVDPVPSVVERISELEEAVCELYEMLG